ncbi:uncharacterized protein V1518DRAFT_407790 [Limtongia smithiae]|uniref:uncharacterized protein n=1 Tax=Limtongia smithiae TaxID=1125753 RepID=UPI0034CE4650
MLQTAQDAKLTASYVGFAVFASLALYVLMPSFFSSLTGNSISAGTGKSKYVVGLVNNANDCFANSDLQALASSPVLRKYLQDPRLKDQPLTTALAKIIDDLNTPITRSRAISPWPFLHVLERVFNSRISRRQHDAHELLHRILEILTEEHKKALKDSGATRSKSREFLPFEGTIVNTIKCLQCGNLSKPVTTDFIVLTLNVPQTWGTKLDDCLSQLLTTERIPDYGCQSCRLQALIHNTEQHIKPDSPVSNDTAVFEEIPDAKSDPAGFARYLRALNPNDDLRPEIEAQLPKQITSTITRTTSLHHLPDLLILHLSRSIYSSMATRNSCSVQFHEYLTLNAAPANLGSVSAILRGEVIEDANKEYEDTKTYKLVAVIRHQGTHSAGHYECYRRKEIFKDYSSIDKEIKAFEEHLAAANISSISVSGASTTSAEETTSSSSSHSRADFRAAKKALKQYTGSKTWWHTSDDSVGDVSVDEVLRQYKSAYLLLYERIDGEELLEYAERRRAGKL